MSNSNRRLSNTQKDILKAVYDYQAKNNNWYPVVRDIQKVVKGSTSTIGRNISQLVEMSFLDAREKRVACRITSEGFSYLKAYRIIPQKSEMPNQVPTEAEKG